MITYEQWASLYDGKNYDLFYICPKWALGGEYLYAQLDRGEVHFATTSHTHWCKGTDGKEYIYSETYDCKVPLEFCFATEEEAKEYAKKLKEEER